MEIKNTRKVIIKKIAVLVERFTVLLRSLIEDLNNSLKSKKYNKQNKSVWGMPRLSEAKKDVISCEKLRGLAHTN